MQDSTARDYHLNVSAAPANASHAAIDDDAAVQIAGRRLDESVLQSAQEAVLSPVPDDEIEALGYEAAGDGYARPPQNRVAVYVAEHPVQSALLAAAVGGLAVVLLKSSLKGRSLPTVPSLSGAKNRLSLGLSRVRGVRIPVWR